MRALILSGLTIFLLMLVACSPDTGKPAVQDAAATPSHEPTQADIDRFLAEGPEPTLQALRPLDYWLQYKMMQATGIEQALGGETQAVAALKALNDAYERRLRSAEADAPKMIPAAFTGEGMASGMGGLAMGAFGGMITGGMMSGVISSMSDEQLAELANKGPIKFGDKTGGATLQVGENGSLTQALTFEVNEAGLNGTVKMKIHMDGCPDPEGKVTVNLDVDSAMSVSGKPGTGGHVHTQFSYERYLDDDAHLISGTGGSASNMRIQIGGTENFKQQGAEITTGFDRSGEGIWIDHNESGFSIFRPEEVKRTEEMIGSALLLNTLVAEVMLRGLGSPTGSAWEGGQCVKLDVTSDPGKRKRIRPNTAFDIDAKPRTKADGTPTGGTVAATLSGDSALHPATGKVPADAKYQYTGPDKKNQAATIEFEARSKRGVGKATLEFDTMQGGYRIVGGQNDFEADAIVCSIEGPFDIPSGVGIVMHMTPSSEQGGSWTLSGVAGGVTWSGGGKFTLTLDPKGYGEIKATGTSTVNSPLGAFSDSVEPTFRVSPASGEDCQN